MKHNRLIYLFSTSKICAKSIAVEFDVPETFIPRQLALKKQIRKLEDETATIEATIEATTIEQRRIKDEEIEMVSNVL